MDSIVVCKEIFENVLVTVSTMSISIIFVGMLGVQVISFINEKNI